jgi:hypothetical protein
MFGPQTTDLLMSTRSHLEYISGKTLKEVQLEDKAKTDFLRNN